MALFHVNGHKRPKFVRGTPKQFEKNVILIFSECAVQTWSNDTPERNVKFNSEPNECTVAQVQPPPVQISLKYFVRCRSTKSRTHSSSFLKAHHWLINEHRHPPSPAIVSTLSKFTKTFGNVPRSAHGTAQIGASNWAGLCCSRKWFSLKKKKLQWHPPLTFQTANRTRQSVSRDCQFLFLRIVSNWNLNGAWRQPTLVWPSLLSLLFIGFWLHRFAHHVTRWCQFFQRNCARREWDFHPNRCARWIIREDKSQPDSGQSVGFNPLSDWNCHSFRSNRTAHQHKIFTESVKEGKCKHQNFQRNDDKSPTTLGTVSTTREMLRRR